MVLFLASPHAGAITGEAISIDGGSTPEFITETGPGQVAGDRTAGREATR